MTSLTGCDFRIQNERDLTLAGGHFSASGGGMSAVGLWGT